MSGKLCTYGTHGSRLQDLHRSAPQGAQLLIGVTHLSRLGTREDTTPNLSHTLQDLLTLLLLLLGCTLAACRQAA
jgi:hypothetical protein